MGKKISPEKKALDALREGITQLVTCRSQLMETNVARVELVAAQIRSVLCELMITDRFLKKLVKKKELEDEQNAARYYHASGKRVAAHRLTFLERLAERFRAFCEWYVS